jgi:signal transduction histidine kinase
VNSLRARLILGFSLVAILPLALAMVLLEQRIQHTVRAEAAARLDAANAVLRRQLADDGARLGARLRLLARDAQLKRLQLAGPEAELELRQYLEDQRFLLGLDYLAVTDSAGRLAGDASLAARPGERPLAATSLPPAPDSGSGIVPLAERGGLALDARAPITYADIPVGAVRGGLRLDSLFLARLQRTTGLDLVLRDGGGRVTATTLQGALAPEPRPADTTVGRVRLEGRAYFTRETPLVAGAVEAVAGPRLTVLASAAAADDAITVLRLTALALGGLGVLVAIVLGLVWSHQVSRPVVRLAGFSERISRGEWDEPLAMESMRELQTLVEALERMRRDLGAYRDRLRASERQAAYGQMARRVAHEIKNPLTPIALSVAGLQRAYAQQRPDFAGTLADAARTVSEEVHRLKQLLHEFGELGRFPPPRPTTFDLRDLLRDLGSLHAHDVEAGRLGFEIPAAELRVHADQDQLRRALLNLAQNALDATAAGPGRVWVRAGAEGDIVRLTVADNGPGLTDEQRANLFVPGFTTKAHGSGLGLTLVERIVTDHGGTIEVESAPGRGTTFILRLPGAG